jgi:hypothetical protein
MIAAAGPEDVAADRFTVVLGELHLAMNTTENRLFVERHPDPARLLAASEHDHGDRRMISVPTKLLPQVNSRMYPPALLSQRFGYWCLHDDSGGAAGPVIPAAALEVHRDGGELVVRSRGGGGTFDLLELLGEQLTGAVLNAFRPLPPAAHQPRITIDRLVIHRETWRFPAVGLAWAWAKQPAHRFRSAQRWRAAHDLPQTVFYRVPTERKPIFLDFASPLLVDRFAKAVRQAAGTPGPAVAAAPVAAAPVAAAPITAKPAAARPAGGDVTVSEMLPGLDELWLPDRTGNRYTSELRLVLVGPAPSPGGRSACRTAAGTP